MNVQKALLIGGPAAALALYALMVYLQMPHTMAATGALTLLCALWWVFEPLPIPATALIPLAGLPLLGVLSPREIAQAYGDPMIILLMGGALLSKAMESSGAHRRLAIGLIRLLGGDNSKRLVIGFMVASALLSMWVSNTATALMLLPVALAVLDRADPRLALPLLLGIAYGCSIGGLGTPIGTPPNIIFLKMYSDATGQTISFFSWMLKALPLVLVLLPLAAWWLTRRITVHSPVTLASPGPWRAAEVRVLVIFALTALAWMTMEDPWGGWKHWLGMSYANYGSVALVAVVAMFLCPDGKGRLLTWEQAKQIEWGVLILFAGGIALANAFISSGLSDVIGQKLTLLTYLPVWLMVLAICLSVTLLSNVTSNTATTTLLMPILAAAAAAISVDPKLLMLPAALSASCAFMLPVATPPNAIVFASGKIRVKDMAEIGLVLNLGAAVVITLFAISYF